MDTRPILEYNMLMAYKDKNDPRLREARLRHYYKNKQQYLDRNKVARAQMREYIDSFKRTPCTDCGIEYPTYVMQFDHIGTDKEYTIARLVTCGNYSKVDAEVAKCEVVCANCHAIRTYRRLVQ